jgi:hypothetical protein
MPSCFSDIDRAIIMYYIPILYKRNAMSDRIEAARFMRESAEQLRRIANLQSFLAPRLLKMARELEERADQLESAALGEVGSRADRTH